VGATAGEWYELGLEVRADTTLVYFDGVYLGAFDAIDPGTLGLVASMSTVEFDDFVVRNA